MIFSTINPRVKTDTPRDRDFKLPERLNQELLRLLLYVKKDNTGLFLSNATQLRLDEDYFLSFMSYAQREQANDPWPFCRRGMWPEYLMGMPVRYTRNAGWNIALEIYGEDLITDTGTSEEPPYG